MTDNIHPLTRAALPGLTQRYASEKRFRLIGLSAVVLSLSFLVFLIGGIAFRGMGAFVQTEMQIEVSAETVENHTGSSFALMRKISLENFEASARSERRLSVSMVGEGADEDLENALADLGSFSGTARVWVRASDDIDVAWKADLDPEMMTTLRPKQVEWLQALANEDRLRTSFNTGFFTNGDSREAERAGIGGAFVGSLLTLSVCLLLSFAVGILAAIYLEEFAVKNKFTAFLEVNINNLATVPSIIFGLLGLAVFLNVFGLPRSSSLVGGMVLALMTLPTIIIASRVSLQAVPPSIREAALGLGATRVQAVFHHVLPLALPGMLTGTILGMARALGETAPLLMIGMVAFIADVPGGFTDPATALPVQVYLWSDIPERAFAEKTSGAILVLLVFLLLMNLTAIIMRKKLEKKW